MVVVRFEIEQICVLTKHQLEMIFNELVPDNYKMNFATAGASYPINKQGLGRRYNEGWETKLALVKTTSFRR